MSPVHGGRSVAQKLAPRFGVFVAALILCMACSSIAGPSVGGSGSVIELRIRWAHWRAAGPESYSYAVRTSCFCTIDRVTPARVEVRDGRVVDARAIESGEALPAARFEPVDSLFAYAIRVAEGGGPVEVRYHSRLSYPTFLEIGTLANDAGVRYDVSELTPLP